MLPDHQESTRGCPIVGRREFLGRASAVGVAAMLPVRTAMGDESTRGSEDKLNVAIIGCENRGRANMAGVASENIYALCDTNPAATKSAKAKYPEALITRDWRELIEDGKIDAVVISTADHHHAPISIAAMRAGKHVYCEKPLAHTVEEARLVQEVYLAADGKIATQMGTQIHAGDNYRRVVEIVQSGMIGEVTEAHVWCSRDIRPVKPPVLGMQPIPDGFAWDTWLGPAADRPYNEGYWKGGNLNWNRRWEFGNGVLGDMGSHLIDLPFWALELRRPSTIASEGPPVDDIACPTWQQVTWTHAARPGSGPHHAACKVVWYHGGEGMNRRAKYLQPLVGSDTQINKWGIGVAFVGHEGTVVADYDRIVLSPGDKFRNLPRPDLTLAKSLGHYREWIHAAKTGGKTLCNFAYSSNLIEHNLLGNVAHRLSESMEWNSETLTAENVPDSDQFISKSYRDEWKPQGI